MVGMESKVLEEELMTTYKVGYIVGSLSKDSINRLLARAMIKLAPPGLEMIEIPIGHLPLYNRDHDNDYPPHARELKERIAAADAILFVTPEYNRSIPGALKNAIDWASRPFGKNAFHRKPTGMVGASMGKLGTAIGQSHLRSIMAFCNAPLMNSIEVYIQFTPGLITDDGTVTVESTEQFLRTYMTEYHAYIQRVYMAIPRGS
jgi:chromate reductase